MSEGVTFLVPLRNGAATIRECVSAIAAEAEGRACELIVVDDGSRDDSVEKVTSLGSRLPVRILTGDGHGAAAALNIGLREARYPIVCQVDQDVIAQSGWLACLLDALSDPSVAAAQGVYTAGPRAGMCARAMNVDLLQRYAAIRDGETDHVCTGNTVYRREALECAGGFDETLGYGYDNDASYRLRRAGHRLKICPNARAVHHWREGFAGYLRQQYGFGYGRLDLLQKHKRRVRGDAVSPAAMMMHPVVLAIAAVGLALAAATGSAAAGWMSSGLIGGLIVERTAAGLRAAWRFRTPVPLVFPVLHLARDAAWVAAIGVWCTRRLLRQPAAPEHSMRARVAASSGGQAATLPLRRVLCLIPAHNEAPNLTSVVCELRAIASHCDILIVDDGSTDATNDLVRSLGVRWLHFPERLGVGNAIRAGLRLASRLGYDAAVRIDGDGQHRAADIERLLQPLRAGEADVVIGTRFPGSAGGPGISRLPQRILAATLSAVTGRAVTDPTSGFCAIGRRAMTLLAEHHPAGYGEPELRLFLSRNALTVLETPVLPRERLRGRTSLTPRRVATAAAHVALAMLIVPLRQRIGGAPGG